MDSLPDRPPPSRPFGEIAHAWITWFGVGRLIVTAMAVLGVGAGGYWLLRAPPPAIEGSLPYARSELSSTSVASGGSTSATTRPADSEPSSADDTIVVYVAGSVVSPGVYRLGAEARVQQALTAAGGPGADADLDAMNLAAPLRDGDRVYVPHSGVGVPPVIGVTGAGGGANIDVAPARPISLNSASAAELDVLPGVGPSTAAAIVAYREVHGPFASVDELLNVRGIGTAKLDAIRALVTM